MTSGNSRTSPRRPESGRGNLDEAPITVDLVLALHSPVGEKASLSSLRADPSAFREFALIEPIMCDLETIWADIRRNPYRTLAKTEGKRLLHEVHQFSSDVIPVPGPALSLPSRVAKSVGMRQLPAEWLVQDAVLTYDVYENRLLKHFLWCPIRLDPSIDK